jgi:methylase of polypeptide subunit release factors
LPLADGKPTRASGAIYTPPDFAEFLVSWAIRRPGQIVLDTGVGVGVFTFAAYRRLVQLGTDPDAARTQIYGAEVDSPTYSLFRDAAAAMGGAFPNVVCGDFFDTASPPVDAVIGNPPYVRRTYIEDIERIRGSVVLPGAAIGAKNLPRLTDLYVYFLLRALTMLKPGGRLAVITADSWLNVGYGEALKAYLHRHFVIESLISLDRRVFSDAQVKPVLLLATKEIDTTPRQPTQFVRLRNGLPISSLNYILDEPNGNMENVTLATVDGQSLDPTQPWGIHFKAPELYERLAGHRLMTTVAGLATTRVGLQTLAKDFFVLTREQAIDARIEPQYLRPLAQSARYCTQAIIVPDQTPTHYLFYCSASKDELEGTQALAYILRGESAEVPVRGKGFTVTGYHTKERIQRSHRKHWYDLRTAIERRGRAAILVPRLVYRSFRPVWNQAAFVPGELFIEFLPFPLADTDVEAYLAILASSIFEVMLRNHAQLYGGGTYNINPGQIKRVPILNVTTLTSSQKECLKQAYRRYLATSANDRSSIDAVVADILGFDAMLRQHLAEVVADLVIIATASKRAFSTHPERI